MGTDRRSGAADAGVSLLELLVVMAVIGILAAIAIPVVLTQEGRARDASATADARRLGLEVASYYADHTAAPTVIAGGGRWLVSGTDAGAVTAGTSLGTVASPPLPTTSADTTGWTASAWCLNVLHPGGRTRFFRYSAQNGLESGSCSTASHP
jgi:prepilin-type N-terminal cleavage/methylation domain-containing protein